MSGLRILFIELMKVAPPAPLWFEPVMRPIPFKNIQVDGIVQNDRLEENDKWQEERKKLKWAQWPSYYAKTVIDNSDFSSLRD